MVKGTLGKIYKKGETIIQQGESGDCMYAIQGGQVEVIQEKDGEEIRLALLEQGDFFGEMAIFEREVRSATVRAMSDSSVLTVDKKNFLRRIQEDPSLAFRLVQSMSGRIRTMSETVTVLKTTKPPWI